MAFEDYKRVMFEPKWKTSARRYGVLVERNVKITMSDGVKLSCNL